MKTTLIAQILLPFVLGAAIPSTQNADAGGDLWQPAPGSRYQMILSKVVDLPNDNAPLDPASATIWDVDLFNTYEKDTDLIPRIKRHGKGNKVICYFSAGTSETFRPDVNQFKKKDMGGLVMKGDTPAEGYWDGENWLDIRSPDVFKVMQARIKLAKTAGCDGIDPDNLDAWDNKYNNNGRSIANPPLTKGDSITYIRKIAAEARKYGMSTGLKNAMDILPDVEDVIQFAVNEQCAEKRECSKYSKFLQKKPVFQVEYTDSTAKLSKDQMCLADVADKSLQNMSTMITTFSLDGKGEFCDGTT